VTTFLWVDLFFMLFFQLEIAIQIWVKGRRCPLPRPIQYAGYAACQIGTHCLRMFPSLQTWLTSAMRSTSSILLLSSHLWC
jgi:hypothetical protein